MVIGPISIRITKTFYHLCDYQNRYIQDFSWHPSVFGIHRIQDSDIVPHSSKVSSGKTELNSGADRISK